jgi:hypothetical protein
MANLLEAANSTNFSSGYYQSLDTFEMTQEQYDSIMNTKNRVCVYNDVTSVDFKSIDLNVSNSQIVLTTVHSSNNELVNADNVISTTITWDELKAQETYSGFDRWIINADSNGNHEPYFNMYVMTQNSKLPPGEHVKHNVPSSKIWNMFFQVITVPEASGFDQCYYFINCNPSANVTSNVKGVIMDRVMISSAAHEFKKFYYPKLASRIVSQDTDGAVIELGLPNNANTTAYVKSNFGFAPSKVNIVDGRATFNFNSFGMNSSDTTDIKIGFKWFSGLTKVTYTKP